MKTNLKKVLAFVVALTLALAMAIPAFADDGYSITADESDEHDYVAFQIFKGEVNPENLDQLANIEWGEDIDSGALLEALSLPTNTSAATVAGMIVDNETDPVPEGKITAKEFAKKAYASLKDAEGGTALPIENADPGYYLIVDTTELVDEDGNNVNDALSAFILKVVNNVDITPKKSVPSVDKAIVEDGEDVDATTAEMQDVITFKLTGHLPSTYADYEHYYYVFHDTLSDGFTLNDLYDNEGEPTFTVTVGDDDVTDDVDEHFTVSTNNEDGCSIEIIFDDLKNSYPALTKDSAIVITYTATLNTSAKLGSEGNPNDVYVEFTNDPKWDGEGDSPTGDTPKETVTVYTFGVEFDKVDEAGKPITGAQFKLFRDADPEKGETGDNDSHVWAIVDGNGKITGWADEEADGSVLKVNESEEKVTFMVDGLDVGTYGIRETKSPTGYNKAEDTYFTVVAGEDGELITEDVIKEATVEEKGEVVDTLGTDERFELNDIQNLPAIELPGTGGIGTTIFYTVGGLMIAAALAYLCISNMKKKAYRD